MKRRFSLFTYLVMDMKAAEAELNRRAEAGWRLERLWLGSVAVFVPAHVPVRYCLDWCDNVKDGERSDYQELLAQAGWKPRMELRYWNLYEAPVGTAPIQTDGALEYRRFREKVLGRMARVAVWSLLMMALSMLSFVRTLLGGPMLAALLWASALHMMGMAVLLLPFWVLGSLIWLGRMLLRLVQWRRAAEEGCPTPVPGRWSGRAGALLDLAGGVSVALLLAALAWDVISGCLPLLVTVGLMLLLGVVWTVRAARGARQGKALRRWAAAAFLLAAVSGVGGMVLAEAAPATLLEPPMEEGHLFPGATEVVLYHRTGATMLLACTDWDERSAADAGPLNTRSSPLGTRFVTGTRCTVWRARCPWLAAGTAALLRSGAEPVEGFPGVWREETADGELWLIHRDTLVLRCRTNLGPLEGDWLANTLALLEEETT